MQLDLRLWQLARKFIVMNNNDFDPRVFFAPFAKIAGKTLVLLLPILIANKDSKVTPVSVFASIKLWLPARGIANYDA
jgi:hypothetical protein